MTLSAPFPKAEGITSTYTQSYGGDRAVGIVLSTKGEGTGGKK